MMLSGFGGGGNFTSFEPEPEPVDVAGSFQPQQQQQQQVRLVTQAQDQAVFSKPVTLREDVQQATTRVLDQAQVDPGQMGQQRSQLLDGPVARTDAVFTSSDFRRYLSLALLIATGLAVHWALSRHVELWADDMEEFQATVTRLAYPAALALGFWYVRSSI